MIRSRWRPKVSRRLRVLGCRLHAGIRRERGTTSVHVHANGGCATSRQNQLTFLFSNHHLSMAIPDSKTPNTGGERPHYRIKELDITELVFHGSSTGATLLVGGAYAEGRAVMSASAAVNNDLVPPGRDGDDQDALREVEALKLLRGGGNTLQKRSVSSPGPSNNDGAVRTGGQVEYSQQVAGQGRHFLHAWIAPQNNLILRVSMRADQFIHGSAPKQIAYLRACVNAL
ncbi:hypothetical protein F1559_003670 [Cyanidiococcus yangmingshanensis]|uniref:Uncharacterized protein n=1 Tax=Cyanidiococcus yangmingshanensis TaxID=2690220 RepID=A0A7J7IQR6_9RHOD|nr:hypothetical protein F1559_003670 [Cyanidiococcus yangmingshanensis]